MRRLIISAMWWVMDRLEDAFRDEKPYLNDDERDEWYEERRRLTDLISRAERGNNK